MCLVANYVDKLRPSETSYRQVGKVKKFWEGFQPVPHVRMRNKKYFYGLRLSGHFCTSQPCAERVSLRNKIAKIKLWTDVHSLLIDCE